MQLENIYDWNRFLNGTICFGGGKYQYTIPSGRVVTYYDYKKSLRKIMEDGDLYFVRDNIGCEIVDGKLISAFDAHMLSYIKLYAFRLVPYGDSFISMRPREATIIRNIYGHGRYDTLNGFIRALNTWSIRVYTTKEEADAHISQFNSNPDNINKMKKSISNAINKNEKEHRSLSNKLKRAEANTKKLTKLLSEYD